MEISKDILFDWSALINNYCPITFHYAVIIKIRLKFLFFVCVCSLKLLPSGRRVISAKADDAFNCKPYKTKFKYECRVGNKIFFYVNAKRRLCEWHARFFNTHFVVAYNHCIQKKCVNKIREIHFVNLTINMQKYILSELESLKKAFYEKRSFLSVNICCIETEKFLLMI